MSTFLDQLQIVAPLFILVLIGYLLVRLGRWPKTMSDAVTKFVFAVAIPALLFRLLSNLSALPPIDTRVLIAYFGGCLLLFVIGRLIGKWLFRLDGVSQSVFALGGIFSNNVLLGVPLAKTLLGDAAMPTVALIVVCNTLTLWLLVTVSVEWARHGEMSLHGFGKTVKNLLANPVIVSILAGTAFGLTGLTLPAMIEKPLSLMADSATPLALVVLGMGLAEYGVRSGWREGLAITSLKLIGQPLAIWIIAWIIGLPALETQTAVLLASLSVGVNVYLMAREFDAMQSAVASSMVLSTALAVLTTPLALSLMRA